MGLFTKPAPQQMPLGGETPPRGKAGTRAAATPRAATTSAALKKSLAGMLMTINLALIMIPATRRDVLDMNEIDALADALTKQADQSKRFRAALETALQAGAGGNLIGICAIIGARRAARHGILPLEADGQLGALLAGGLSAKSAFTDS